MRRIGDGLNYFSYNEGASADNHQLADLRA